MIQQGFERLFPSVFEFLVDDGTPADGSKYDDLICVPRDKYETDSEWEYEEMEEKFTPYTGTYSTGNNELVYCFEGQCADY